MDWHFINTDKNRQSQDEWIRRGIAVTTDRETLRDRLGSIPPGDRLLMYVNREGVLAVGEVLDSELTEIRDPRSMVNPRERVEFHKLVRWDIDLRRTPLPYGELPKFAGVQPTQALQKVDKGKDWIVERLRGLVASAELHRNADESTRQLVDDVAAVQDDPALDQTTREALVQARLGQGKFRRDLIDEFQGRCAVTEVSVLPVLRASHIVPWRASNNQQRLDPDNGLLLCANLDALFDQTLITFGPRGEVAVSSTLSEEQLRRLSAVGPLIRPLNPRRSAYLALHNQRFRQEEARRAAAVGVFSR